MRNRSFIVWVFLLVHGVFVVDTGEVKISVMEGDSVTLIPDLTEIKRDETIFWAFGQDDIARINREDGHFLTYDDERFIGRLEMNEQTVSLTIRNIKTEHSGLYKLQNTAVIFQNFLINVKGVFSDEKDGVKTVSEKTGNSVLLDTHVAKIQNDDISIEWTFGPQNISIAKLEGKGKNKIYNYNDVRFNNRLYLQIETGDLTIKNANSEHSGLYQLKIINNTYTIQKRFSVTVSGHSGLSSGAVAGIVVGVFVAIAAVAVGVIYHRRKTPGPVL